MLHKQSQKINKNNYLPDTPKILKGREAVPLGYFVFGKLYLKVFFEAYRCNCLKFGSEGCRLVPSGTTRLFPKVNGDSACHTEQV